MFFKHFETELPDAVAFILNLHFRIQAPLLISFYQSKTIA